MLNVLMLVLSIAYNDNRGARAMISNLELRQIIESAFLPMKCVCTIDDRGFMTVSLYHPERGHVAFVSEGIRADGLTYSLAITRLVAGLKHEFSQKGLDHQAELGRMRG
jgi:hypothetical protein